MEKYQRDMEEEKRQLDSFFDEKANYSVFTGRVTDRDKGGDIMKVSSENKNIKFFRTGDELKFTIAARKGRKCQASVRGVEEGYIIIWVKDLSSCWSSQDYFRRGTLLVFESEKLQERVRDAAIYRMILINRKKDFYTQLNGINHFLWSFEQQKLKAAGEYDQKIIQIQQQKEKALEDLVARKHDSLKLQKELSYQLDQLDRDLEYYRIDKTEPESDRWHLDHDLGLPTDRRPTPPRYVE
ncbi:MAG: hypothetical protein Fur0010_10490 [Bdellovibrio sp.]